MVRQTSHCQLRLPGHRSDPLSLSNRGTRAQPVLAGIDITQRRAGARTSVQPASALSSGYPLTGRTRSVTRQAFRQRGKRILRRFMGLNVTLQHRLAFDS